MSALLSPGRSSPQPLPSLPPSPTGTEEDLGRPIGWTNHDDDAPNGQPIDQRRKGKERATDGSIQPSYAEGGTDDALTHMGENRDTDAYPPRSGDEAETRRIEENLRRWETSERERRKAARTSAASTASVPSTSLVATVARRASLLWSGKDARPATDGGIGTHRPLGTSEDAMPLDDIAASPSPSPTPTRTTTPILPKASDPSNPFSDPIGGSTSTSSLFVNQPASAAPPSDSAYLSPTSQEVHPPAPLDLPSPRSPPPRTETPHAKRPPEPRPPPGAARTVSQEEDEDEKPVRWWHDWLCGCGEGHDRGGEVQAGATNPME
ncbi:hypothetical protein OF83DRAFT_1171241 [Amylostereum chailletii]|nr:hypothetical protein OF83DRAFT_1171241 [Amylostereum chailletii]